MLREHSEAHHTHIDPDVGLLGARGRLLPQEQQVPGEQLQLSHVGLAVLDHLQKKKPKKHIWNVLELHLASLEEMAMIQSLKSG